jgi:tetratricopeptide (TPR) repeat protein
MSPRPQWLLLTALAVIHLAFLGAEPENPSIALLRLDDVKQSVSARPGAAQQDLVALTDGTTDQFLEIELKRDLPLDLVYHLPAVATCQQLVITADTRELSDKQLPRVEVLVSTISDQAGFQSIRSLNLKASVDPQTLELPPSAAQWIIVRIISPLESITLQIAEIDIQGNEGLPETRYAFKESPAKAFDVLAEVQKSVPLNISEDEADLFKDASDGKLDEWTFAEAALLSSGVLDAEKRKKYLAQIDRITEQAKAAVKDTSTPFEKGEALLVWLHKDPMKGGYETHQTDLSTVLADGTFNCVSSATLYNIIGRRLDLDLRAIEVPEHAFSIHYEGTKHVDVETTISAGFNPARDPRVLEQFTRQTGFNYIPDRHADQRREVTDIGLLALTYYNHGVVRSQKKQHAAALVDYFRALSLDPEFHSAIQNILGTVGSWSSDLSADGEFEQALNVLSMGLRLAPDDKGMRHNQKVTWQKWAITEIKGDRRASALEILARASKALPEAGFEEMQAFAFIYSGQKLVEAKKWELAVQLATDGLDTLPPVAQKELRQWRINVVNRWAISVLDKKQFAEAADILEQAMKADPAERDFANNTAYLVQQWLEQTRTDDGREVAEALMVKLTGRFGELRDVQEVIETFLRRVTYKMVKDGQFDEAVSLIDRHRKLMGEFIFRDLIKAVFGTQARKLVDMEKWMAAIAVYSKALKKLPRDIDLETNLVFSWSGWAGAYQKANDWSAAGDVYLKALDSGIDDREMGQRVGYCVQELALRTWKAEGPEAAEKHLAAWVAKRSKLEPIRSAVAIYVQTVVQKHGQEKQPAMALVAVDRCRKLLKVEDHQKYVQIVCDQWAKSNIDKSQWEKAIAVYTLGLKSLPKDSYLTRNAVITWDQRASVFIKDKKWADAIKIYEQALTQFPDNVTLRNNLKYCQQQAGK